MALPYINLYVGDIKKDTDLLTPEAFGGYVRLLFKMHEAIERGKVSYTLPQLCRVFGAANIEQTINIVNELTDPANDICQYEVKDDKHLFTCRRMVRETEVSKKRSEAGKKGAEKTNSRFNQQTENFAGDFDAANGSANESTKPRENYNTNIGINNSNSDCINEGVQGEQKAGTIDPGATVLIVPELLTIWKTLPEKRDYVVNPLQDYPALREIGEMIAKADGLEDYTTVKAIDRIKTIFYTVVTFAMTDSLYKDFQLSQISKYFNAIASKCKSKRNEAKNVDGKPSVVSNNVSAAGAAKEFIKQKYAGQ